MPKKEAWKAIGKSFPLYEVSDKGRVRNTATKKVLNPFPVNGYGSHVNLRGPGGYPSTGSKNISIGVLVSRVFGAVKSGKKTSKKTSTKK